MSAALDTPAAGAIRTPLAEFWRRFLRQRVALVSGAVILALILAAALAPLIAPFDPSAPDYDNVLAGPSALHLAGTDAYGRDILSRIIWGGRVSLAIGFLSVALGGPWAWRSASSAGSWAAGSMAC